MDACVTHGASIVYAIISVSLTVISCLALWKTADIAEQTRKARKEDNPC
jgi:hypothetical protein